MAHASGDLLAGKLAGCAYMADSDGHVIVSGSRNFVAELAGTEIRGSEFQSYAGDTGTYAFRVKAGDRWLVKPGAGFRISVGFVAC